MNLEDEIKEKSFLKLTLTVIILADGLLLGSFVDDIINKNDLKTMNEQKMSSKIKIYLTN
jgi:hypothetical protein